ncbi:DUF6497 family protein [Tropicimonas sediminicola]|uniref:Acetolactate synthase n=1 Tax=Tropicimonas sediminicola TaxID=1031541 RepID=A0A239KMP6_9RHOB|nr:DUF6497 family protein [Tropicimonas sediminicola]SNT19335.1 hypothetical protein SAMN05421757_107226 [Tropicimonas sediminicola]
MMDPRGAALAAAILLGGQAAAAQEVSLPSGLVVSFHDRIVEVQSDGETWLTLRYISPRIGAEDGEVGYDEISADLDALCETQGRAEAAEAGAVQQVNITLMDRAIERGTFDPEATMFIGAYLLTDMGCVWQ